MTDPVRLLLVEDEPLFLELVASALGELPDLEVVGAFSDAPDALARAEALGADVALLDIELGGEMTGVDLGLRLRRSLPEIGIVLFSSHAAPDLLAALPPEQTAGWSYLLKSSVREIETVRRAIRGATEGHMTLDPSLTAERQARAHGRLDGLTPRQLEILQLIAEGLSNAAIAERLVLARKSVENYINALFIEIGVDSGDKDVAARVQAARIYLEETTPSTRTTRSRGPAP